MKKIILVDGNNLLFRSFYATAYQGVIMKNSKGFPTNALYGFINMMNKIIKEENPSYIMVAFDKGKTFRHDKYEEYKAGRSETPDELKLQFPKAKEVLEAMGIKYYETDNYEADDIIGTLSKQIDEKEDYEDDKFECFLVGNPRANGHVAISTKKHFKDMMEIDNETCKEIFILAKKVMIILKETFVLKLVCSGSV